MPGFRCDYGFNIHTHGFAFINYNCVILDTSPVHIEANAVICGEVTIGKGSIIGAGSVVTRVIPAGVVAAGTPCRPLRPVTEADKIDLSTVSF